MAGCLFREKAGFDRCRQAECLERHEANCCAVCFNKQYCRALCPWVKGLLDRDKERRTK